MNDLMPDDANQLLNSKQRDGEACKEGNKNKKGANVDEQGR